MNTTAMKGSLLLTLVFAGCVLASSPAFSWHGGGWNRGWHGGGWHGGWHGGWYGGGWRHVGWYGGAVVVGGPVGYGYYYAPVCQRVRYCNAYGGCWIQRRCY